ncbi:hypothetical protein IVA96_07345 [Bradyrhizobium sp. 159]|uniref:hypothetical protein n=1 Tax=Bradyrhizobium sp. 159 TaxID=2782632 RepID=UPI001FF868D1|nr:hypothetical protein [Bradyrhizobium sp. 159]MCK1616470.1 hypothetical protein [Bradyrhizobium sp. 159]
MDTRAIRMGMIAKAEMIATDPTHVAMHCHAADMNASAEAAHVRTSSETAHVSATAETSAVTATTTSSAAAACIRRADSQCGGKRSRSQDHHHSFHQNTPCI